MDKLPSKARSNSAAGKEDGNNPERDGESVNVGGLGGSGNVGGSRSNVAGAVTGPKEKPVSLTEFFVDPRRYDPTAELLHTPVNAEGDTGLYIAAKTGHFEAVRTLLEAETTKVNAQNHKGITAIAVAAHKGRLDIVNMLIEANADVNIDSFNGSTPLIQASHFGHVEVVKTLVKAKATVDKANNKGTTALMRATQEGNEEVVRILVAAGADVSLRNNERMNALMLGSQRGHAAIVSTLILHCAEIDAQTAQGSTALMLACKRGHAEVVKVLLTAGAEIHMQDSRGRTAKDTATRRQHGPILAMLSPSEQIALMQAQERKRRAHVLAEIFEGSTIGERTWDPEDEIMKACPSLRLLTKILASRISATSTALKSIASYLPLPRVWDVTLAKLPRRCHVDATEAIRESFQLMDEVIADLGLVGSPDQSKHLVRIREDKSLQERLRTEFGMPQQLLGELLKWSAAQEVITTTPMKGVTFSPPVAVQVVHVTSELVKWYQSREYSMEYCPVTSNAQDMAGAGTKEGDADGDGDSSDGEMEEG